MAITGEEWKKRSINGELCAVIGCYEKPTSQCPQCLTHYCYEHIKIHMHVVK